jgi:hypothetical protein
MNSAVPSPVLRLAVQASPSSRGMTDGGAPVGSRSSLFKRNKAEDVTSSLSESGILIVGPDGVDSNASVTGRTHREMLAVCTLMAASMKWWIVDGEMARTQL